MNFSITHNSGGHNLSLFWLIYIAIIQPKLKKIRRAISKPFKKFYSFFVRNKEKK